VFATVTPKGSCNQGLLVFHGICSYCSKNDLLHSSGVEGPARFAASRAAAMRPSLGGLCSIQLLLWWWFAWLASSALLRPPAAPSLPAINCTPAQGGLHTVTPLAPPHPRCLSPHRGPWQAPREGVQEGWRRDKAGCAHVQP
jgi:hypothetical protein